MKELELRFYEHDFQFKIYKSIRANLNSEVEKLGFSIFHYVFLALARQDERRHQLIILSVWNITSSESLFFSIHSSCWMQDAKFE